jgi:hypothetical protein
MLTLTSKPPPQPFFPFVSPKSLSIKTCSWHELCSFFPAKSEGAEAIAIDAAGAGLGLLPLRKPEKYRPPERGPPPRISGRAQCNKIYELLKCKCNVISAPLALGLGQMEAPIERGQADRAILHAVTQNPQVASPNTISSGVVIWTGEAGTDAGGSKSTADYNPIWRSAAQCDPRPAHGKHTRTISLLAIMSRVRLENGLLQLEAARALCADPISGRKRRAGNLFGLGCLRRSLAASRRQQRSQ